jgi:hypothetical protein
LPDFLAGTLPEIVGRKLLTGDTDNCEFLRKQFPFRQIVKRGKQLTFGEIASGAEDDHRAGWGLATERFLGHFR